MDRHAGGTKLRDLVEQRMIELRFSREPIVDELRGFQARRDLRQHRRQPLAQAGAPMDDIVPMRLEERLLQPRHGQAEVVLQMGIPARWSGDDHDTVHIQHHRLDRHRPLNPRAGSPGV